MTLTKKQQLLIGIIIVSLLGIAAIWVGPAVIISIVLLSASVGFVAAYIHASFMIRDTPQEVFTDDIPVLTLDDENSEKGS